MKFRLLALISVFLFCPAYAVEVDTLYTAQVPFDQEQADSRTEAYALALQAVILRVSGSALVADVDLYEALFPRPTDYVVQFRPGPEETLFVTFDGEAIERKLRDSGKTYWGGDRPLTLIWLAVDWGRGEREIVAASDAEEGAADARSIDRNRLLRERILDVAERRGLPVAFPLLDSEDLAVIEFSDLWGGFDERILRASERYDADSILVGRIRAGGPQRNRWTYFFGPERFEWNGEAEFVLAQVADLLAAEFAIRGDLPLRTVDLNVAGINSVDAYGAIQALLADIHIIDSFSIAEVSGDTVRFRVAAVGGAERLARALRFAGLLEEERIDMNGFEFGDALDSLDFFYSP